MSDSIKSADRRLKLLLLLQSSKHLSVNKIADYFGISRRTVFRDLRALQDLEVPIIHDSVEGYSLIKGYKVPPLMFTERELASIVLGLSFMKSQLDMSMKEDAQQVLLKIKSVIPANLLSFIHSIEEHVITSPYYSNIDIEKKVGDWFLICSAISEKTTIQFQYKSEKGESNRTIHPYFIVLYHDHWNVIGFDVDRQDRRNFRLDLISKIAILPERFAEFDLKKRSDFIYNIKKEDAKKYQIEVKSDNIELFLKQFPGLITQKESSKEKQWVKIDFVFDNEEWLASFLIAHFDSIKINTENLKNAVKKQLQVYLNRF